MMKKIFAVISLAAVILSVAPAALATNGGKEGKAKFGFFGGIFRHFGHKVPVTSFVISGTVVSADTNNVVVKVQTSANIQTLSGGQATIATDSNTKVMGQKNAVLTLADVKAGDRVEISGNVSGITLTATNIKDLGPVPAQPVTTSGKVTAASATSITLQNGLTNTSQVFTIDSKTKVTINGTSKAVADIQVGDAGSIHANSAVGVFTAKTINLFR